MEGDETHVLGAIYEVWRMVADGQWLELEMVRDAQNVFFFQAEDGIRYLTVTGVQTCALPISIFSSTAATAASAAKCRKFFSRCRSNGATRNRKSLRCTQTKCTWHMGITVLPPPRNFISANRSRT